MRERLTADLVYAAAESRFRKNRAQETVAENGADLYCRKYSRVEGQGFLWQIE